MSLANKNLKKVPRERVTQMAKLYTVENLLIGKRYNSASINGIIVNATATDKIWFGTGLDSYLIEVREDSGLYRDHFRYVAVRNGEI
jgi:hypothetical protein